MCKSCGRDLPPPAQYGPTRLVCPTEQCEDYAEINFRKDEGMYRRGIAGFVRTTIEYRRIEAPLSRPMGGRNLAFILALSGLEPGRWLSDRPAKRAIIKKVPNGSGDLNPFDYLPHDDAVAFVKEFGRSGPDVGQTYIRPCDITLGDTGNGAESGRSGYAAHDADGDL